MLWIMWLIINIAMNRMLFSQAIYFSRHRKITQRSSWTCVCSLWNPRVDRRNDEVPAA